MKTHYTINPVRITRTYPDTGNELTEQFEQCTPDQATAWGLYTGTPPVHVRDFQTREQAEIVLAKLAQCNHLLPGTPEQAAEYNLCEAIADIAYIAGQRNYYAGDSRQDIADMITLAREFCTIYPPDFPWDGEYIELIGDFACAYFGDKTQEKP